MTNKDNIDDVSLPETVYTADSILRNPGELLRKMLRDVSASRELGWALFVRDLSAQYRKSLLGYVWVLLPPLANMLVWVFLNKQGILNIAETSVPYPMYVLIGVLLWDGFLAALNSPMVITNRSKDMLAKVNFPREALLISGFGEVLFTTTVRLVLLIGVFVWFGILPPAMAFFGPLAILSVLLLGFSIGLLLVPLGLLYQDVGRAVTLFAPAWFIMTPVIYPPPTQWPASLLNHLNPISPLLTTTRDILTTGEIVRPMAFAVTICMTFILLVIGWLLYRLSMPHLIARMSA